MKNVRKQSVSDIFYVKISLQIKIRQWVITVVRQGLFSLMERIRQISLKGGIVTRRAFCVKPWACSLFEVEGTFKFPVLCAINPSIQFSKNSVYFILPLFYVCWLLGWEVIFFTWILCKMKITGTGIWKFAK